MDDELAARLDELGARLDRLTALVEHLAAALPAVAPASAAAPDPLGEGVAAAPAADDAWRRLGLSDGERRTVTVLFADITGFTALSERLDPEAFQLVMRDTMALLGRCVVDEGGTLEKFIGDALCAIFGAPIAHPDEPHRAARAALAMHEVLVARAAERPDLPPLGVHVGVNTGPVIAGAVGDGSQFGVMGDTINTAARLMGLAADGETLLGATTARRLRGTFHLEDRGVHEVKGKANGIATFGLVRALTEAERREQPGLHAPLLGRQDELDQLDQLSAQTAAGDGLTVVLVGDEGAGASRLVEELARAREGEGWRVLSAPARVHAESALGLVATAFGPLLAEDAGAVAGGEAGPLADTLRDGAQAPHDFELVLGEVVTRAARRAPLLVVLEDADDADPGSIEVIRYLSRVTAQERVLWLLTGRTVPEPFEALLGTEEIAVVRVEPLPEEVLAELFQALFPGALGADQRARLAHLAEGNVQFAMAIAGALVDEGVVVQGAEGWLLVGDPDALELPGSVAELIEARIDRLPTASRIALLDASVIGMRFGHQLLARVASSPATLDTALADLVDAELVRPPTGDDGMWSFRSRLVRDVAYGSVLRRHRPGAHRAVADALVDLEPARVRENADLLAHHYEESDDPPLALPHLLRAAERAEAAYNLVGTLDRCRRALRLRDRYPGRLYDHDAALVLERAGITRLLLGDRGGLADLEAAAELLLRSGTPLETARIEEVTGWFLTVSGEREAAVPHLQRAQALAEERLAGTDRDAVLAAVATTRAFTVGALGDLATGLAAVDGAAAEADAAGDRFTEARARLVGGVLRLWRGDPAGAVEHLRHALAIAWADGIASIADRCGRWLVLALVEAGEGAEARLVAEPLLARADDRGDPTVAVGVRAALAGLARVEGDLDRARELARAAVALAGERAVAADAAAEAYLVLAQTAIDELGEAPSVEDIARARPLVAEKLARVEEAAASEPWLQFRFRARAAVVGGRFALRTGDVDGALAAAAAARVALGRADAARERAAADRLEEQARTAAAGSTVTGP